MACQNHTVWIKDKSSLFFYTVVKYNYWRLDRQRNDAVWHEYNNEYIMQHGNGERDIWYFQDKSTSPKMAILLHHVDCCRCPKPAYFSGWNASWIRIQNENNVNVVNNIKNIMQRQPPPIWFSKNGAVHQIFWTNIWMSLYKTVIEFSD